MRSRDRTALALAPIFLRLALAVTFLWAGLGKFIDRHEFVGEQAAILANYGLIPGPGSGARSTPDPVLPDPPAEDGSQGAGPRPLGPTAGPEGTLRLVAWQPEDAPQTEPQTEPQNDPQSEPELPSEQPAGAPADGAGAPTQPAAPPRVLATAADFPEPVSARAYAGLVVMLHQAIHPGLDPDDSSPRKQLWPDIDPKRDFDHWPVWAARAVALTELVGGILIAIGLLTRLAALAVGGVMLGALWLTVIGPAIQSGNTVLGILPDYPPFDMAWQMALTQFIVLCAAIALFFAGPGTLSLDRLLVGGPPRPATVKPAPAPPTKH